MKAPKTIKSIKAANDVNTLLAACAILEHRPNLANKQRQGYNKTKERLNKIPIHNTYRKGYEDGYRYAIERLQRHSG